jgi:hypothetical protein
MEFINHKLCVLEKRRIMVQAVLEKRRIMVQAVLVQSARVIINNQLWR